MDDLSTLTILRSSTEQVALPWGEPKPSTWSDLASVTCNGHAARWPTNLEKHRHRSQESTWWWDDVGIPRCGDSPLWAGRREGAVESPPGSINIQTACQLLPGFVPNLCRRISRGNVISFGMSRHRPRRVPRVQLPCQKWGVHAVTCAPLLDSRPRVNHRQAGRHFTWFLLSISRSAGPCFGDPGAESSDRLLL